MVAIGRNRSQSVAIGRNRSQSVAIGRNRSQSVGPMPTIRSRLVAIGRADADDSVAIGRDWSQSVGPMPTIRSLLVAIWSAARVDSVAIGRDLECCARRFGGPMPTIRRADADDSAGRCPTDFVAIFHTLARRKASQGVAKTRLPLGVSRRFGRCPAEGKTQKKPDCLHQVIGLRVSLWVARVYASNSSSRK